MPGVKGTYAECWTTEHGLEVEEANALVLELELAGWENVDMIALHRKPGERIKFGVSGTRYTRDVDPPGPRTKTDPQGEICRCNGDRFMQCAVCGKPKLVRDHPSKT